MSDSKQRFSQRAFLIAYLKCIDTGCGQGGLLTALDVVSGQVWQVTETGLPA